MIVIWIAGIRLSLHVLQLLSAAAKDGRTLGEKCFHTFPSVIGCGEGSEELSACFYSTIHRKAGHGSKSSFSGFQRKGALGGETFRKVSHRLLQVFP